MLKVIIDTNIFGLRGGIIYEIGTAQYTQYNMNGWENKTTHQTV